MSFLLQPQTPGILIISSSPLLQDNLVSNWDILMAYHIAFLKIKLGLFIFDVLITITAAGILINYVQMYHVCRPWAGWKWKTLGRMGEPEEDAMRESDRVGQKLRCYPFTFAVTSLYGSMHFQVIARCQAISNLKICMGNSKNDRFLIVLSYLFKTYDSQGIVSMCLTRKR